MGGSPQWSDSGWTIHGGARASSKASYNLAGGFVEFDMDLGGAHGGVNNNFYITFPNSVGNYCDSGGTGGCAELDFVENNGKCSASAIGELNLCSNSTSNTCRPHTGA